MLWTALAGLAVGGVLFWLWWAWDAGTITLYVATTSLVAAAFCGLQYLFLTARVVLGKPALPQDEEASSDQQEETDGSEAPEEAET